MNARHAGLLGLLLLACGGDRQPAERALPLFRDGREALDAGEHEAAAALFARAAAMDPQRPVLRSWQAYALAAGGDPAAAIALLEATPAILSAHDRYNMAAWHARLGHEEQALSMLAVALQDEPTLRDGLDADPDFSGLVLGGALDVLSDDVALRAVMLGEEGAILAGERYDLELDVQAPGGAGLALRWGQALPEGFGLRRVVDERSGADGEASMRSLHYRLATRGGGEGSLGPWTLQAGERSIELPAVPWETVALPGADDQDEPSLEPLEGVWWTPREALEGLDATAAAARHGLLVVCHQPGDRVAVSTEAVLGPGLEIELRDGGQALRLAKAWRWAPGRGEATVTVTRKGETMLEQVVERP
jgi:tetratricopeptide (TPR) repeat protein